MPGKDMLEEATSEEVGTRTCGLQTYRPAFCLPKENLGTSEGKDSEHAEHYNLGHGEM